MPATEPQHSAWERIVLGAYADQVSRWFAEYDCRVKVRAANAAAYKAVSGK